MPILEISTVVGCRMGCDYCPQKLHAQTRSVGEDVMEFGTFVMCEANVPADVVICFAGMAEPFLNPEAVAMVEYAAKLGRVVDVFTTGYGLSLADVDRLAVVKYRHFCLHLPDAAGRMSLPITAEYLEVVRALRAKIRTTVMCIGQVHPEVEAVVGPVTDGTAALQSRAGNLGVKLWMGGRIECSASPTLEHNILGPAGHVWLCCMDYGRRHVLGNLMVDSWETLQRASIIELQRNGGDVLCRTCECARAI